MGNSPFQSTLDPVRVLVIDPSERVRDLYRDALVGQDCELMFAADGFDALGKIDDWGPTLVFAPTQMPRLDGYRLTQIVKRNKRTHATPVVLVSHEADMFDRAKGRLCGADEHLVFPLSAALLLDVFTRLSDAV